MNAAKLTHLIVFVVTSLYTLIMFLTNASLPATTAKIVSYVPTAVGWGLVAFDLWVWQWPIIHRFVGRPMLDGTWRGTLTPSEESHIPPDKMGPREIALVIEQTYWSIGVTLLTAESSSQSTTTAIRADAESPNRRVLAYAYVNTPDHNRQAKSPPHSGAVRLRLVGRLPMEMSGTYWTDRFTAGDMRVELVDRKKDYPSLAAVVAKAKPSTSP